MTDTKPAAVMIKADKEQAARIHRGELHVKNILCPVDFSEYSAVAFRLAASLGWHFRARVFLHHTAQISGAVLLGAQEPAAIGQVMESELVGRQEQLRILADSAGVQGPEVLRVLGEGDPVENILQLIREREIDLLVMGTHGHKGFSRLMLGSVAERIIHEATCPVLVVSRPQGEFLTPALPEAPLFRTILFATDFSKNSDRALAHALRWAAEWGGRVVVLHAVEDVPAAAREHVDLFPEFNPSFERQLAEAWEKIHEVLPEAAAIRCAASLEVRSGNPKEQILKVAEETGANLIVMGAHGHGATSPWGSVSSGVVREGKLPVLVVRRLG